MFLDADSMKQILTSYFGRAPRGSQSRIADELGVRVQTVNKWAKGYNIPEPQHWRQLEQLLDLPAGTFAITPLGADTGPAPADVLELIRQVSARLDVVEQQLGLLAPARSDPSDRTAP